MSKLAKNLETIRKSIARGHSGRVTGLGEALVQSGFGWMSLKVFNLFAGFDHSINHLSYFVSTICPFVRQFWAIYQVWPSFKVIFVQCYRRLYQQPLCIHRLKRFILNSTVEHSALLIVKERSWQKPSFLVWRRFYLDRQASLSKANNWGNLHMWITAGTWLLHMPKSCFHFLWLVSLHSVPILTVLSSF